MPKEQITSATVTDDHIYTRSLHVAWGAKGGRPEAPEGWVNAGFAEVQISEDHGTTGSVVGVSLDPEEIDHLIRTLKRVRRQAFRNPGTVEIGGQSMTEAQYSAARFPLLSSDPAPTVR